MVLKLPPLGVVGTGDGDGRVGADVDWGERHNGKAKNKAYPRIIRNS